MFSKQEISDICLKRIGKTFILSVDQVQHIQKGQEIRYKLLVDKKSMIKN